MADEGVRFHWKGTRQPTRAELRALALRAQTLHPGDYDARPERSKPRAPAAKRAYREFHWGNAARKSRAVTLPSYDRGIYELGKLRAVEYETRKGNERAIWVHDFTEPFPTLTATPSGKLGPIVGGRAYVTDRGIEK